MEIFLQATISLISKNAHPACEYVAGRLSAINYFSGLHSPTLPDHKPLASTYLESAYSNRNRIDLCEKLAAVGDQLIWTEAPRRKISSFMDDNHAMVQMVGPDYGYFSDDLRFGAFLLAPNTIYPLHSHAAEEIYIPISGSGHWRLQESPCALKIPGSIVHCQSWLPHAIRSGKEPLLMLWAWFGNISFETYRIESNAFEEDGTPI